MKVLLINGSPHREGCTYTALTQVAATLEKKGVETELIQIGSKPVGGCVACNACRKTGHCAFGEEDGVNECIRKLAAADGVVVGSPVHYASAGGSISGFMDRVFYAGAGQFTYKPGAAVVSCRRGGASVAFDRLNKYFTINQMPVVSSYYWNSVHGNTPEEVLQDLEGMQVMARLGENMAWLLACIQAGREAGIAQPVLGEKVRTNFIR